MPNLRLLTHNRHRPDKFAVMQHTDLIQNVVKCATDDLAQIKF